MPSRAEAWREALALASHPEGGWFRELHRSDERVPAAALDRRFAGERALSTSIVYLLRAGEHSRFHRLRADEVWHLYDGGPLWIHLLEAAGLRRLVLGRDPARGECPQGIVPHGAWFAAEPAPGAAFALAGCTVSPGFEYGDFEIASRATLLARHPGERALIERLTSGGSAS